VEDEIDPIQGADEAVRQPLHKLRAVGVRHDSDAIRCRYRWVARQRACRYALCGNAFYLIPAAPKPAA
jgi:hypothetical protein